MGSLASRGWGPVDTRGPLARPASFSDWAMGRAGGGGLTGKWGVKGPSVGGRMGINV